LELGLKAGEDDLDERLARLEEAWQASGAEPGGLRLLSS
jgi:hypothetical protein